MVSVIGCTAQRPRLVGLWVRVLVQQWVTKRFTFVAPASVAGTTPAFPKVLATEGDEGHKARPGQEQQRCLLGLRSQDGHLQAADVRTHVQVRVVVKTLIELRVH